MRCHAVSVSCRQCTNARCLQVVLLTPNANMQGTCLVLKAASMSNRPYMMTTQRDAQCSVARWSWPACCEFVHSCPALDRLCHTLAVVPRAQCPPLWPQSQCPPPRRSRQMLRQAQCVSDALVRAVSVPTAVARGSNPASAQAQTAAARPVSLSHRRVADPENTEHTRILRQLSVGGHSEVPPRRLMLMTHVACAQHSAPMSQHSLSRSFAARKRTRKPDRYMNWISTCLRRM